MRAPPLWQISTSTRPAAEEAVSALFQEVFGRPPSIYVDADTSAVKVSMFHTASACELERPTALLQSGLACLRKCGLDPGNPRVRTRRIRREQWAESWKRHFKPLEIGDRLLIKPSWSRRKARSNQAVITLDPGLSFGTGQHPTTLFCLEQIVRHRRSRQNPALLDIGTGSGILAISAAALGYRPVEAFDFDPAAVGIARENSRANGVERLVHVSRQDLSRLPRQSREKFDVVCANLTADLLLSQRDRILDRLTAKGVLVLAGILATQFPEVRRRYESAGMRLISTRKRREWQSASFCRT